MNANEDPYCDVKGRLPNAILVHSHRKDIGAEYGGANVDTSHDYITYIKVTETQQA